MSPTTSERREGGTAWLLRFLPYETVEDSTKRILVTLTDEMVMLLGDPEELGTDKTIHEVRRRGKQARALLRLVRPAIPDDFKAMDRLYRNAGRLLAPARDARIVVDVLDDLTTSDDGSLSIRSALENRAATEATRVFDVTDNPASDAQLRLKQARSIAKTLEIPDEASSIAVGATRIYTAGQKAYRRAAKKKTEVAFHTWRKRVKQRRHHIAYLWDCSPMDPTDHDRLYELSDLLGAAHDLVVFRDHLEVIADGVRKTSGSRVLEAAEQRRTDLEAKALLLGSVLFGADTQDVHNSLVSKWDEWRRAPR